MIASGILLPNVHWYEHELLPLLINTCLLLHTMEHKSAHQSVLLSRTCMSVKLLPVSLSVCLLSRTCFILERSVHQSTFVAPSDEHADAQTHTLT